jgi:hypothetical protein
LHDMNTESALEDINHDHQQESLEQMRHNQSFLTSVKSNGAVILPRKSA